MQQTGGHQDILGALLNDSYKLVMTYSFFQNKMENDQTAFELIFRKCPFGGQYVIFAGLNEVVRYIKNFKFTDEEIEYVKKNILPSDANPKFFEYLKNLDSSQIIIRAMPEGSICFPKEPLISIEGPQGICQLIETAVINLVSFPSLIATNASRMRQLAGQAHLLEFGLRRAQGPDGGMSATQYSFLGGFDGTSNMMAGLKLGIPVSGTIAHSFVTSFSELNDVESAELNGINIKLRAIEYHKKMGVKTNQGELASFIAYAQSCSNNFLCLVDTYHTLKSGVPNFLAVAFALDDAGIKAKGIRLDSGDLAQLSIQAKELFKQYGDQFQKDISHLKVAASNDINEEALIQFNKKGHKIDIFGIGTHLVTCQKQPALGLVYKLVECKNQIVMKLSEEYDKTTFPGQKNVYRVYTKSDQCVDIITSINYLPENNEFKCIDHISKQRYHIKPTFIENLLQTVDYDYVPDLMTAKKYCTKQMKEFNTKVTRLDNPQKHLVLMSIEYYKMFQSKYDEIAIEEVIE
ncbi:unnamed protein product [Paramecium pentaurelia]|uniref:Nicotinate phosphoribosyltransferase n=1 Tax=Paramecium pentaurelia TaxID=43138 RepID=A0A8S1WC80_9CILI|nr:unnamed protein product [Paramecium pentaurelia]